jgi:hypothetical protein
MFLGGWLASLPILYRRIESIVMWLDLFLVFLYIVQYSGFRRRSKYARRLQVMEKMEGVSLERT